MPGLMKDSMYIIKSKLNINNNLRNFYFFILLKKYLHNIFYMSDYIKNEKVKCEICKKMFVDLYKHLNKENPCVKSRIEEWKIYKQTVIKNEINKVPVLEFNDEQKAFINYGLGDLKVIGIPGGGKSNTIVYYCIKLSEYKIIDKSDDFLILSFSKRANTDFRNKGIKVNKQFFSDKNIRTFHSLAHVIMLELFKKNTDINTLISCVYYNLLNNPSKNLRDVKCLKHCKFIIVDEAQDISDIQYRLIMFIKQKLNINLILVGDPNQNIFQFQNGSDKYLNEYPAKCVNLIKNYRSTNQIIAIINHLKPWSNTQNMISGMNRDGNKPIIYCDNWKNIIEHMINDINKNNYKLEDIAIIGPVKKANANGFDGYKNIGLQLISNFLTEKGIAYKQHYTIENENDGETGVKIEKGHVNLLTIHGSKGLEFKKVYLINFHLSTYGRKPTIKQYNEYKYIWYVAVSRAIDELIIYVDEAKLIWPIYNIPDNLYVLGSKKIKLSIPNLDDNDNKPLLYTVRDIIDNNILNEDMKYNINKMIKPDNTELYTISSIFDINLDNNNIIYSDNDNKSYSVIYGIFFEKLFTIYYNYYNENIKSFIDSCINKINNTLTLPKNKINIYNKLSIKIPIITELFNLKDIEKYKNYLDADEDLFIKYIEDNIINKDYDISIIIERDECFINNRYVINKYNDIYDNIYSKSIYDKVFDIIIYDYQIENEAKYLMKKDYTKHLIELNKWIDETIKFAKNIASEYKKTDFQVKSENKYIPIIGISDIIINDSKIIEIKFAREINEKYALQLLLYYNNIYPDWDKSKDLEIWNLYDGKKYIVNINNTIKNIDILMFLSKNIKLKIKNCVFIYNNNNIYEPYLNYYVESFDDFIKPLVLIFDAQDRKKLIDKYGYNLIIKDIGAIFKNIGCELLNIHELFNKLNISKDFLLTL